MIARQDIVKCMFPTRVFWWLCIHVFKHVLPWIPLVAEHLSLLASRMLLTSTDDFVLQADLMNSADDPHSESGSSSCRVALLCSRLVKLPRSYPLVSHHSRFAQLQSPYRFCIKLHYQFIYCSLKSPGNYAWSNKTPNNMSHDFSGLQGPLSQI